MTRRLAPDISAWRTILSAIISKPALGGPARTADAARPFSRTGTPYSNEGPVSLPARQTSTPAAPRDCRDARNVPEERFDEPPWRRTYGPPRFLRTYGGQRSSLDRRPVSLLSLTPQYPEPVEEEPVPEFPAAAAGFAYLRRSRCSPRIAVAAIIAWVGRGRANQFSAARPVRAGGG